MSFQTGDAIFNRMGDQTLFEVSYMAFNVKDLAKSFPISVVIEQRTAGQGQRSSRP